MEKHPSLVLVLLLPILFNAGSIKAETFTTLDGEKYIEATVKQVEPDGIIVAYHDGITKLKFKNLPPDVGVKYGYDPKKEALFRAAKAEADLKLKQAIETKQLQQQAAIQEAQLKQEEVQAAHKKSEELKLQQQEAQLAIDKLLPPKGLSGTPGVHILKIVGKVQQMLPDGFLLASGWENHTVEPYTDQKGILHDGALVGYEEPLFIIGPHGSLVDGDSFSGLIYPAGTYSYGSVIGANKTVRCYATTPESAAHHQH